MVLLQRLLFFILFVFSIQAKSQVALDYKKVIADKTFSCNNDAIRREGTTNTTPVYSTGLKTICQSNNELEIRFYLDQQYDWYLYALTYNNGKWTATEYWYDFSRKSHDPLHPIKVFNLKPQHSFDTLFERLKENHVFTLPDAFHFHYDVDYAQHWCGYLTFKANNQFRRYRIKYPEDYGARYPKVKAFRYYDNIMTLFTKDLNRK